MCESVVFGGRNCFMSLSEPFFFLSRSLCFSFNQGAAISSLFFLQIVDGASKPSPQSPAFEQSITGKTVLTLGPRDSRQVLPQSSDYFPA